MPTLKITVGRISGLIFLIGFALRLLLLGGGYPELERQEPIRVAINLVERGEYGGIFGAGTGPTAHCMPLHPLLIAALILLFGTGAAAGYALSVVAAAAVAATYALLPRLSVLCGLSAAPGIFGGLLGALLPVNFWTQTSGLFDAPFTSLAMLLFFITMARAWFPHRFNLRTGLIAGLAAGITCLLNPIVLLVLGAFIALGLVTRRSRDFAVFTAGIALSLVLLLTPWVIRNQLAFGTFVLTRSNFGLELSVSNNDVASGALEANVRNPAWAELHPTTSVAQSNRLRELGELRYNAEKRQQAVAWIQAHPARFAALTVSRFRNFWFPVMLRSWQTALEALLTVMAIIGAILLWRRHEVAALVFFGPVFLSYPAVYYVVQASPRYRFPLEPLMLILAGYVVSRMIKLPVTE